MDQTRDGNGGSGELGNRKAKEEGSPGKTNTVHLGPGEERHWRRASWSQEWDRPGHSSRGFPALKTILHLGSPLLTWSQSPQSRVGPARGWGGGGSHTHQISPRGIQA